MSPSIIALFKQGRFSLHFGEEEDGNQNQRERFAVAAIALVLKHDEGFRKHFLHTICECPRLAGKRFEIEIEPADWGDLVLKSSKAKVAYIIEFKVGATLQPHQNPARPEFWRSPQGYFSKIMYDRSLTGFDKHYVTLEQRISWNVQKKTEDTQLFCRPRTWEQLKRGQTKVVSDLEKDLCLALGYLGVSAFDPITVSHMKFTQQAANAAKIHHLLSKVCDKRRIKGAKPDTWVGKESEQEGEHWYYGLAIPKARNPSLARIVAPPPNWRHIGWFGYEGPPSQLAIHLYCSKKTRDRVCVLLKKKFGSKQVTVEPDDVIVRQSHSKGDLEWFTTVFRTLTGLK